ncbi:MAG TPA: AraC family transcriptional regulator [Polyangiaceae bacterium]|nr:AraC family transcriptional regulator [Polyangiaceae bacterium]
MRNDSRQQRRAFSRRFLSRARSPDVLLDHLPDVYFFVKDADGRFVRVNRAFLDLVHAGSEEDVIGARDTDFFPTNLAEGYVRDDGDVIRIGQPIIDKAELVRNVDGSVDWFFTTKLPVLDKSRHVIGVCGITRDVKRVNPQRANFSSWAPVLEAIVHHYATPLVTVALAREMGLSLGQFNRQFRKRFHTTARAYQRNVRLKAACQLLLTTSLSMAEIASRTGFYDQSHFSAQFVRSYGMPPSQYRTRHAEGHSADPSQGGLGDTTRRRITVK